MAADSGNAATVTFGSWTFTAAIISITPGEESREALDVSHLGTTSYRQFIPGDLVDASEWVFTYIQDSTDADKTLPPNPTSGTADGMGARDTVTITLPEQISAGDPPTFVFTGFVTSRTLAPLENDTVQVGTFSIKPDGGFNSGTVPVFTEDAAA